MPPAKIKRYRIQDVEPGMIIGKTLLAEDGKLILDEGTILTDSLIDRLYNWGIYTIDIKIATDHPPAKSISHQKAESYKKFAVAYQDTIKALNEAFSVIQRLKMVPVDALQEIAHTSVWPMAHAAGALNFIQMLYSGDDHILRHSLNVAVISGILGRWMGFSGPQLQDIILAGLLHDVGKLQVPPEILYKQGKLSESERALLAAHAVEGYKMLRNSDALPWEVLLGVLQHHERLNGTGYPLQLKKGKIHPYAQIVAVADIYDAMTSEQPYRNKLTPLEAVETLVQDMFEKLSPSVCTTFLNNLLDHFIGNTVRLSDGREGEIIFLGKTMAQQPIIKTNDGEFIDLAVNTNISIVDMPGFPTAMKD